MARTIDEALARKLAVKADCDPRTIRGVLSGKIVVKSLSSRRAKAVLEEVGLLKNGLQTTS